MTDISYANASFYGCTFESYQDTWYTGRNASTYVVDSIIFGQTDCKYTRSRAQNNSTHQHLQISLVLEQRTIDSSSCVLMLIFSQVVPKRDSSKPRLRWGHCGVERYQPVRRSRKSLRSLHRRFADYSRKLSRVRRFRFVLMYSVTRR